MSLLSIFHRGPKHGFLVTCSNRKGGMFRVTLSGRSAKVKRVMNEPSTGLAISPETAKVYAAHFDGVRVFSPALERLPKQDHELQGAYTHDVKCLPGGLLAVVETARDKVAAYTPDGEEAWSWSPTAASDSQDRHHINSVQITGDRLLASMFTPEPLQTALGKRLEGGVMAASTGEPSGGELLYGDLRHPHSLVSEEGAVWLCESRRNRVLRYEGESTTPEVIADKIPGYTRGLCLTEEYIVVGQSRSDGHFVEQLLDEEPTKEDVHCGLWFFPRDTGDRFFIELPAQEVYDILAFPAA